MKRSSTNARKSGNGVSIAVAEAVRLANADVIAAYPITPQTHIVNICQSLWQKARSMLNSSV